MKSVFGFCNGLSGLRPLDYHVALEFSKTQKYIPDQLSCRCAVNHSHIEYIYGNSFAVQVINKPYSVAGGTRKAVQLGDDKCITGAYDLKKLIKLRPVNLCTGTDILVNMLGSGIPDLLKLIFKAVAGAGLTCG